MLSAELDLFKDALRAKLAQALSDAALSIDSFDRRGEGYSWETYLIRVRGHSATPPQKFAVKREPIAGLVGGYDVQREVDLLNATRIDIGCPVPRVVAFQCGTSSTRGFYIMEMVEGVVPMPWDVKQVVTEEAVRTKLGLEVAGIMAKLHAKPVSELRIGAMVPPGDPQGTGVAEVRKWLEIYLEHKPVHLPIIDLAFAWLSHRADAVSGRLSLVHNDLRIGNIIVNQDRVAAVLDWETAEFTDPTADLAKFNLPTFRGRSALASGLISWPRFLDAYEADMHWRPDERALKFWTILEIVKAVVGALRGTHYFTAGKTNDVRYANLAWQSHHSIKWLVELYESGEWGR
jgi:aminoglycoside phosphotransferase (APT) family kinase protein